MPTLMRVATIFLLVAASHPAFATAAQSPMGSVEPDGTVVKVADQPAPSVAAIKTRSAKPATSPPRPRSSIGVPTILGVGY